MECRAVHLFDQTFDFDEFKAEHNDLDSIKEKLSNFDEWEGKIKFYIKQNDSGLVNASTTDLRGRLTKRVKQEQRQMKDYLRELADAKARESAQALVEIQTKLKEGLQTLAGYVAYVDELKACRDRLRQIGDQKKQLDDMRGVLQRFKASDEAGFGAGSHSLGALQTKIEQLGTEMSSVDEQLLAAEESIKGAREGYVEELEKKVLEEQDRVAALIEKVTTSETLLQKDTPPREALEEAGRYKKAFDKSVEKLAQYEAYKDTLGIAYEPCKLIEEFEQKHQLRNRLWQIRQTFSEDRKKWYAGSFRD